VTHVITHSVQSTEQGGKLDAARVVRYYKIWCLCDDFELLLQKVRSVSEDKVHHRINSKSIPR